MAQHIAGLRTPVQQRSQASTSRMLDAALEILDKRGLTGLTIAAVATHAGVGIGTIYHRFTDRHALLVGTQDRFLSQLEQQWLTATTTVWGIADDDQFLSRLLDALSTTFSAHRKTFRAIMITHPDDPDLSARGALSSRRFAAFLTEVLTTRFGCSRAAADTAYRMMYADATLGILFSDDEVSAEPAPPSQRRDHLKIALSALLTSA
jgi:AcrR family transcriptional regulator